MSHNPVAPDCRTTPSSLRAHHRPRGRLGVHVRLRGGRWYWQRRVPPPQPAKRGTSAGGTALVICISLGTCDLALARLRGLMLDAEFERNVLMLAAGQPLLPADFRQALTRYRDRLLADLCSPGVWWCVPP